MSRVSSGLNNVGSFTKRVAVNVSALNREEKYVEQVKKFEKFDRKYLESLASRVVDDGLVFSIGQKNVEDSIDAEECITQ